MRSARPSFTSALAASLLAPLALCTACATGPALPADVTALAGMASHHAQRAPAAPNRLPAPENTRQAQTYLSGALAALRANQPEHATLFLDAILRSDHLSDRGRANIYWLASDAHRLADHDEEYVDALGGFLVAAELLPVDEELRAREVEARSALLARKMMRNPLLGKSPRAAIRVEDPRDAAGVAAELGCVEQGVSSHGLANDDESEERRLEERRLLCGGGGKALVLWFDVAHQTR